MKRHLTTLALMALTAFICWAAHAGILEFWHVLTGLITLFVGGACWSCPIWGHWE